MAAVPQSPSIKAGAGGRSLAAAVRCEIGEEVLQRGVPRMGGGLADRRRRPLVGDQAAVASASTSSETAASKRGTTGGRRDGRRGRKEEKERSVCSARAASAIALFSPCFLHHCPCQRRRQLGELRREQQVLLWPRGIAHLQAARRKENAK